MNSPERLRRAAKRLRRDHAAGVAAALARVRAVLPEAAVLRHADALHVIAREEGFASWPKLKFAAEAAAMDRAAKADRLKAALYLGQHWVVETLLAETPDLGSDNLGLQCALYDADGVAARLARAPEAAMRPVAGVRTPILHLAFSRHIHGGGDPRAMLEVAELLLAHGADPDDGMPESEGSDHRLSALYGAIGHANNMVLARWLLEHGADPNDNESLYHSTELGHHEGLRLLLAHGADPVGTNALLRALDFNDHEAVRLLLESGADANEDVAPHPSQEPPLVVAALHQAARRMCDAEMARMLLAAGADPERRVFGVTPYAMARVYGNAGVAGVLAGAGASTELTDAEGLLAAAAEGTGEAGRWIDPERLPAVYRTLIREIVHIPGKLDHMKRLVAIGMEHDRPDAMGVPPVQAAGWEGLPEVMDWLLSLRPDLAHVNRYGGTLLGTIIHGSENCPQRDASGRDHISCARMALEHGVALPRKEIALAGEEEMAAFLADWAERYPGAVVDTP